MHPLLERQVGRSFGADRPAGSAWDNLCAMIESAYTEADDQRQMVQRSLAILSDELHSRNRELSGQLQAVAEQARVLENLHDAALVLGRDGQVVDCYAATSKLFDLPAGDIIGRSFWDLVRPAAATNTPAKIHAILSTDGRWSGDMAYRRPDGTDGALATTLIVLPRSSQAAGHVLAVAQDVTERRRIDRELFQSQKLDGIGQLAAGVAHEINTPAQYVSDNLRFLEDAFARLAERALVAGAADPEVEATIAEIPGAIEQSLDGMRRISEIVRGIKLFAHPGSGEVSPVDLNHEIESTIAVSRNEWKYVAEMVLQLDPELPSLPGFPREIGHVVLNLVVNAAHAIAEATDNGKVRRGRITVSTKREGDRVEVRVADDGPGIPPEIQARVFDPFFTTKPVGKGTGQGLAISHRIVHEKHGGSLRFESTPETGTTFIVSLPLGIAGEHDEIVPMTGTEGP
jgi:PAS domain S-box-containing protein